MKKYNLVIDGTDIFTEINFKPLPGAQLLYENGIFEKYCMGDDWLPLIVDRIENDVVYCKISKIVNTVKVEHEAMTPFNKSDITAYANDQLILLCEDACQKVIQEIGDNCGMDYKFNDGQSYIERNDHLIFPRLFELIKEAYNEFFE